MGSDGGAWNAEPLGTTETVGVRVRELRYQDDHPRQRALFTRCRPHQDRHPHAEQSRIQAADEASHRARQADRHPDRHPAARHQDRDVQGGDQQAQQEAQELIGPRPQRRTAAAVTLQRRGARRPTAHRRCRKRLPASPRAPDPRRHRLSPDRTCSRELAHLEQPYSPRSDFQDVSRAAEIQKITAQAPGYANT